MIKKNYEIGNLKQNYNYFLFYGKNEGLKNETIINLNSKKKDILNYDEKEVLEDLMKAALNQAKEKVEEMSAEEMKKITGGLPLPPGMKMPF